MNRQEAFQDLCSASAGFLGDPQGQGQELRATVHLHWSFVKMLSIIVSSLKVYVCAFLFVASDCRPEWSLVGLTSKEYQAKCPEYTDSEAQLVQVLVQFKTLQLQMSPVLELSFQRFWFVLFHVIQWLSSARKSCSWGFCEWRGASGHELRIPCPVSFIA